MKLDNKLNLVVPVEGSETMYFHSATILPDTFRRYHFVIAKAFTKIFVNDMQISGPQIAAMTAQEVAEDFGIWEDQRDEHGVVKKVGVKNGLMEEIKRLSNVIAFSDGWKPIPVSDAIDRKLIDEDQWDAALQRIVFFTLTSVMLPKGAALDMNKMACELWKTQLTSLDCWGFGDSLRQSMRESLLTETASPAIS